MYSCIASPRLRVKQRYIPDNQGEDRTFSWKYYT